MYLFTPILSPTMKKNLLVLILLVLLVKTNMTIARIVLIKAYTAAGSQPEGFLPQMADAVLGDTIKWITATGIHTSFSKVIPAGAAAWDSGNSNFPAEGYIYVPKVAGTYNYSCHKMIDHMGASFVVTLPSGVAAVAPTAVSLAYPNPFSNELIIEIKNVDVLKMYDLLGKEIKAVQVAGQTKVKPDVADLPKGVYFYTLFKEGVLVEKRKIVKG